MSKTAIDALLKLIKDVEKKIPAGGQTQPSESINIDWNLKHVTHDELVFLTSSSSLIPGQKYCITDYVTTVGSNAAGCRSAGIPFKLIVTADTPNSLNPKAQVREANLYSYISDYDSVMSNITGWGEEIDEEAWEAPEGIKGEFYGHYMKAVQCPFIYHDLSVGDTLSLQEFYLNSLTYTLMVHFLIFPLLVNLSEYDSIVARIEADEKWVEVAESTDNYIILSRIGHPEITLKLYKTPTGSEVITDNEELINLSPNLKSPITGRDINKWEVWYELYNNLFKYEWADIENSKGVIYRMIDENGNDTPYDSINIQYRIFQGTPVEFLDGTELYVFANDNTSNEFSETGYAPDIVDGSERWVSTFDNLIGDEVVFLPTNNIIKPVFKSIIYDSIPYQAQTLNHIIMANGSSNNTISGFLNILVNSHGSRGAFSMCYINKIKVCNNSIVSNFKTSDIETDVEYAFMLWTTMSSYFQGEDDTLSLSCIVVNGQTEYNIIIANQFNLGYGCNWNNIRCDIGEIGCNCEWNSVYNADYFHFGNGCCCNEIGSCRNLTFEDSCSHNILGNDCQNITFRHNCSCNSFGHHIHNLTMGSDCCYNILGKIIDNKVHLICYADTITYEPKVQNTVLYTEEAYNEQWGNSGWWLTNRHFCSMLGVSDGSNTINSYPIAQNPNITLPGTDTQDTSLNWLNPDLQIHVKPANKRFDYWIGTRNNSANWPSKTTPLYFTRKRENEQDFVNMWYFGA